jgi:hypothetical protein
MGRTDIGSFSWVKEVRMIDWNQFSENPLVTLYGISSVFQPATCTFWGQLDISTNLAPTTLYSYKAVFWDFLLIS